MFAEHLAKLAQALDFAQLPYMLIGGQAVLVHGEPRLTRDLDVTLAVDIDRLPDLLRVLTGLGWPPLPGNPSEFVDQTLVLPCEDPATGIRMDFIFGLTPYEQAAVGRAGVHDMLGVPVRFATAEDLIIHKVLAGRPRDLEDVEGVLAKNRNLDFALIRQVLADFALELGQPLVETFEGLLRKTG
jgi:hypothetical protein